MRNKRALILMAPGLVGFAIFYVIPFFSTCFYAFVRSPLNYSFVGLDNIIQTCQNSYFHLAAKNSAVFTLLSVSCTIMLGILLTFAIYSCRMPILSPFMIPTLLPTVAVVVVWTTIFSEHSMMSTLGVESQHALLLLFIWKNVGIHVITMLSTLAQIPVETIEAAALDGAGSFRRYMYIVIPQLLPTIKFCCAYAVMCSFRIFREAYLLYGAYPREEVFMIQHYIYNHFCKLDYAEVSSAGLIYAIPIILLVSVFIKSDRSH